VTEPAADQTSRLQSGNLESGATETAAAGPVAGAPFTPPTDNPFDDDGPAAAPALAGTGPKVPPMPQCFASIAPALLDQVKVKLRGRDLTAAQCILSSSDGYKLPEPVPMAFLMAGDFANECALALGRYGLIRVTVFEPGSREPWHFAFRIQQPAGAEVPKADPLAEMRRMLAEQESRFARMLETARLESHLAGGGTGGLKETIKELRELGLLGGQAGTPIDYAAMARTQSDAMTAMFEGFGKMRDAAAKFVPQAEKTATDKALDELTPKALGDIYGVVRTRLMQGGQGASGPAPAASPNPVPPAANPFAETA